MLPHVSQVSVVYKLADLWILFCIVSIVLFCIILFAFLWGEFVLIFLLLGICVSHDWTIIATTMFWKVRTNTQNRIDYHNHFHSVLRVQDDSVGVQGTYFVCGSHTTYLQDNSLLQIVQLYSPNFTSMMTAISTGFGWGADNDVCFGCLAFVKSFFNTHMRARTHTHTHSGGWHNDQNISNLKLVLFCLKH